MENNIKQIKSAIIKRPDNSYEGPHPLGTESKYITHLGYNLEELLGAGLDPKMQGSIIEQLNLLKNATSEIFIEQIQNHGLGKFYTTDTRIELNIDPNTGELSDWVYDFLSNNLNFNDPWGDINVTDVIVDNTTGNLFVVYDIEETEELYTDNAGITRKVCELDLFRITSIVSKATGFEIKRDESGEPVLDKGLVQTKKIIYSGNIPLSNESVGLPMVENRPYLPKNGGGEIEGELVLVKRNAGAAVYERDSSGKLTVEGETNLKDNVIIHKDATINENLIIEKNSTIKKDLTVKNDAIIENIFTVEGKTNLNSDLDVKGNVLIGTKMDDIDYPKYVRVVTPQANGPAVVTFREYDEEYDNDIDENDIYILHGGTFIKRNILKFQGGNLLVKGGSNLQGDVLIGGYEDSNDNSYTGSLQVEGCTFLDGYLTVDDDALFEYNVNIKENLLVNGSFYIDGKTVFRNDVDINKNLFVKEEARFNSNVAINGNLTVTGNTTILDTETLRVKDNLIETNIGKEDIVSLSGLAINKGNDSYGIVYNPFIDAVELGLGVVNADGQFEFYENEGLPVVVRDENLIHGHLVKWDAEHFKLVDASEIEEPVSDASPTTKLYVDNLIRDLDDKKLDKITTTGSNKLYSVLATGVQSSVVFSQSPTEATIAQRHAGGALKVGKPTNNNDAATKKYVDDIANKKLDKITPPEAGMFVYGVERTNNSNIELIYDCYKVSETSLGEAIVKRDLDGKIEALAYIFQYPEYNRTMLTNIEGTLGYYNYENAETIFKIDSDGYYYGAGIKVEIDGSYSNSNNYVLLAGGGYKPLSDFPDVDLFVKKTGDTMTGNLKVPNICFPNGLPLNNNPEYFVTPLNNNFRNGFASTRISDMPFVDGYHLKTSIETNTSEIIPIALITDTPDDSNNYASIMITGTIGSWESENKKTVNLVISNRTELAVNGIAEDTTYFNFIAIQYQNQHGIFLQCLKNYTELNLIITVNQAILAKTDNKIPMPQIPHVSLKNNIKLIGESYFFGTCNTSSTTPTKIVNIVNSDFNLKDGVKIVVYFGYHNAVLSPSLNVNNTGSKMIYWGGSVLNKTENAWKSNSCVEFIYYNNYWHIINPIASDDLLFLTGHSPTTEVLVKNNHTPKWTKGKTVKGTLSSSNSEIGSPYKNYARVITVWMLENREYGALSLHTSIGEVAKVEGNHGYWGASILSCSAFIPAGSSCNCRFNNNNGSVNYSITYLG